MLIFLLHNMYVFYQYPMPGIYYVFYSAQTGIELKSIRTTIAPQFIEIHWMNLNAWFLFQ